MVDHNVEPFSHLNDFILVIIVSFLPIKEAVRTSILSKRWQNIWRSTRNVEFCESLFTLPNGLTREGSQEPYSEAEIKEIQRQRFYEFARKWITCYQNNVLVSDVEDLKLQKFRLSLSQPNEFASDVEEWIKFFITRNIEELDLDFSDARLRMEGHPVDQEVLFKLPSGVYEHESLKCLKLSACDFVLSKFRNFQQIREISLSYVELTSSSLQWLISICKSSLKILNLKKCRNLLSVNISVDGLSLSSLSIEDCSPLHQGITITSAETLRSFKYSGLFTHLVLENLSNLEEVDLDFMRDPYFHFNNGFLLLDHVLPSFNNALVMSVCSFATQALSCTVEDTLVPLDAKHLKLKSGFLHPSEVDGIAFLLKSCYMLEKLSIQMEPPPIKLIVGWQDKYKQGNYWENAQWEDDNYDPREFYNPHAFLDSLKIVELEGFRGTKYERDLLVCLLGRCNSLLKMVIITANGRAKEIAEEWFGVNGKANKAADDVIVEIQ